MLKPKPYPGKLGYFLQNVVPQRKQIRPNGSTSRAHGTTPQLYPLLLCAKPPVKKEAPANHLHQQDPSFRSRRDTETGYVMLRPQYVNVELVLYFVLSPRSLV